MSLLKQLKNNFLRGAYAPLALSIVRSLNSESMINNKKVVIIMPAYNAEKTLKQTYD